MVTRERGAALTTCILTDVPVHIVQGDTVVNLPS